MSIYTDCIAKGIPVANHYSDLYIPVTPESAALVKAYEFRSNVTTFQSNIEGEGRFYDVPFAYDPYWEKCRKA